MRNRHERFYLCSRRQRRLRREGDSPQQIHLIREHTLDRFLDNKRRVNGEFVRDADASSKLIHAIVDKLRGRRIQIVTREQKQLDQMREDELLHKAEMPHDAQRG